MWQTVIRILHILCIVNDTPTPRDGYDIMQVAALHYTKRPIFEGSEFFLLYIIYIYIYSKKFIYTQSHINIKVY